MQQLQPEQATFLLNAVFLPELQNEHRITKSILQAIPPDKCTHCIDQVGKSAVDLAWHIAAAETMFMDAVAQGEYRPSESKPESIQDSSDVAKWYEENFEPRFQHLSKLSGEQLTKVVDFRGMFQLPAVMYLSFVLKHTIHHRGQLSMYLRPMGAKIPSIYGESYDAAQARKASEHAQATV
jgi:uncharacterized damage-inducible protein DinB